MKDTLIIFDDLRNGDNHINRRIDNFESEGYEVSETKTPYSGGIVVVMTRVIQNDN